MPINRQIDKKMRNIKDKELGLCRMGKTCNKNIGTIWCK
jgi:hypothetical protein